jgi:hypothetical protein
LESYFGQECPQIKMLLKEIELGIKKKVSLEEWQKL